MPPRPEDPAIDNLLRHARGYAEHMMRTAGSVPPTLIADTPKGLLFCMPSGTMLTVEGKDALARACRILAVAHEASAVAMVMESWMVVAEGGRLDTRTRPSMNPARREVVAVVAESRVRCSQAFLPILRDEGGVFVSLGESLLPEMDGIEGRFAGILPREKPDVAALLQARLEALHLGLAAENMGFEPRWN